eukprot:gnl/TRDRNA2_/TRDRNA2_163880_c1_seq1.p1 gnl/TRDRNA2_/TRDRNA2_163880_c1~~gnl/TRDRNA2_/TRDRNA2_163880_c1_seq1.p1  ORF type:complete len:123 (-),score=2.64 gnl/TRDRNA2_/TRDRNA2_163880_c1_seq1:141-509(-)
MDRRDMQCKLRESVVSHLQSGQRMYQYAQSPGSRPDPCNPFAIRLAGFICDPFADHLRLTWLGSAHTMIVWIFFPHATTGIMACKSYRSPVSGEARPFPSNLHCILSPSIIEAEHSFRNLGW